MNVDWFIPYVSVCGMLGIGVGLLVTWIMIIRNNKKVVER